MTILLLGGAAWATGSDDTLGLAESNLKYQICRADLVIDGRAGMLTAIREGDRIKASEGSVRVETATGDSIFVQKGGEAEFGQGGRFDVAKGEVLFSSDPASHVSIGAGDLRVTAIDSTATGKVPRMVGVTRIAPNRVKVVGLSRPFAVADASTGKQIAVIAEKDSMEFEKRSKGWVVAQADKGDSSSVAGSTAKADDEATTKTKRRRAFWLWGAVAVTGAAAVAGGVVAVVNNSGGDNNNNRDSTSPIGGGGGGGGGGSHGHGGDHHHPPHHGPGHHAPNPHGDHTFDAQDASE